MGRRTWTQDRAFGFVKQSGSGPDTFFQISGTVRHEVNPADMMTKPLSVQEMRRHMEEVGANVSGGE